MNNPHMMSNGQDNTRENNSLSTPSLKLLRHDKFLPTWSAQLNSQWHIQTEATTPVKSASNPTGIA